MIIGLYARVSTAEQAAEGYSIDEQCERLQAYAAAFGPAPAELYVDAGFSGATTDRPGLRRLIADVEAGRVSRVIVYKLDRLSRSQKDTLRLIEDVFLAHGCEFVSMSENFDTGTPFGRAIIGILAVFAQLEREQIRERMALGKEGRAKTGKWRGGGKMPIGYEYKDGGLHPVPFEALQVREAFERFARGETAGAIARDFENKGYRHRFGSWERRRLISVLKNPLYAGDLPYCGRVYPGEHEALVPRDLFERVQAVFALRGDHPQERKKVGNYSTYLGGLLYCAHCGGRYTYMQTRRGERLYKYYTCATRRHEGPAATRCGTCRNKSWNVEKLDALIFAEIKKLAVDPAYLERIQTANCADDRPARAEVIAAELERLSDQQARLVDLYAVAGIDLHDLERRISALNDQRERLQAEQAAADDRTAATSAALQAAASFAELLERGTFSEIRLAIETLIRRVEIDGDDVTIFWRFQ